MSWRRAEGDPGRRGASAGGAGGGRRGAGGPSILESLQADVESPIEVADVVPLLAREACRRGLEGGPRGQRWCVCVYVWVGGWGFKGLQSPRRSGPTRSIAQRGPWLPWAAIGPRAQAAVGPPGGAEAGRTRWRAVGTPSCG